MKKQFGFLELTAATIFGLVAIAASIVGIFLGTTAVNRGTQLPSRAHDYENSYLTIDAVNNSTNTYDSFDNPTYKPEYKILIKACNITDAAFSSSAFFKRPLDTHIAAVDGGWGSATRLSPNPGPNGEDNCRYGVLTIYMKPGWTSALNDTGTIATAKFGVSKGNAYLWTTITFGTAAEPTPTNSIAPTPTGTIAPTPTLTPTCTDSDGGRNYYLKGELTEGNNTCTGGVCHDSCYNGQIYGPVGWAVSEWYCENNIAKRETVNCPSGSCSNGACTGITPTPCQKPTAPSNLTVSQFCPPAIPTGQVTLLYEWEDNSTSEDGFRLYWTPGATGVDFQIGGNLFPNTFGYTESLIPISTCQQRTMYSVASFNECGESGRGVVTALATDCCGVPNPTPTEAAEEDCSGCVGGIQIRYPDEVVDQIDDCSEACRAYFGPDCTQAGCGNPGSTDPHNCCWCKTDNDASCNTLPTPTPVPGVDCREENCQTIPWGGGLAWLNKIVYSIPDVPNYYSDRACAQSIDPYSYCTAAGGGVPYFETDLDDNGATNSLDWDILVTGWTTGDYTALDASLFLWNWAGQN